MEEMPVLQEVVRSLDRGLLVVPRQASLKQEKAEEVEFVARSDQAPLDELHELLVTVEPLVFARLHLVAGDICSHRVRAIAELHRQGPARRVVGWNDVCNEEHDMARQRLLFLQHFLEERLLDRNELLAQLLLHLVEHVVNCETVWQHVERLEAQKLPNDLPVHVLGPRLVEVGRRDYVRYHVVDQDFVQLLGADLTCRLPVFFNADVARDLDVHEVVVLQDYALLALHAEAMEFDLRCLVQVRDADLLELTISLAHGVVAHLFGSDELRVAVNCLSRQV